MIAPPIRAAVLAMATTIALAWQQQPPMFRTSTDAVVVDVGVTLGDKAITGLTGDDFVLLDRGVPQVVQDLTRETLPIDLTLVIDLSQSVRGQLLDVLRRALDSVSAQLKPNDTVRLVRFNERVFVDEAVEVGDGAPPGDRLGLPSGNTSLLDAMAVAFISAPRPNRRMLTIVFTDGNDTLSIVDEGTVLDVAKRANGAVFAVALGDPFFAIARSKPDPPHAALFRFVTAATGGRFEVLYSQQDLGRSFVQALEDFRTSYILRYQPTGVDGPGWHDLQVTVRGHDEYAVRARSGYFGGQP